MDFLEEIRKDVGSLEGLGSFGEVEWKKGRKERKTKLKMGEKKTREREREGEKEVKGGR